MKKFCSILFIALLVLASCQKEEIAPRTNESQTKENPCSTCDCCMDDSKMGTRNGSSGTDVSDAKPLDGRRITDPNNDEDEERAKKTQR